jgi:integrase
LNRRRLPSRRSWPANVYCNDGYFYYRNPTNGKTKGLGRDQGKAFSEARAANKVLAAMTKSDLAAWVRGIDIVTFKAWIPEFLTIWQERDKPAVNTVRIVTGYLERAKKEEFASKAMNQITTVDLSKYLDRLEREKGGPTAAGARSALLTYFSYAVTKGHVEAGRNPVEATLQPKIETKRDRLSLEQFLKIREAAPQWLRNGMNLALVTGQRVGDISEMRFTDVQHGYLQITQQKTGLKLKHDVQIRLNAVNLSIQDAIKACRDGTVSAFMIHKQSGKNAGEKYNKMYLSAEFKKVRDELKIKGAVGKTPPTFHEIRSLSERLYRQEYDKEFAQQILGHQSEATTAKYDDLRGSDWKVTKAR